MTRKITAKELRTAQHPLEVRPVPGYTRRVHASAFARAVETVASFDDVDHAEAARRVMAELDAGTLRLVVTHGMAAYQHKGAP